MAVETVLVYNFTSGDNTYPHSGNFTIGVAGKVSIDDSNGFRDAEFGDLTHTGGSDEPDQDVVASTVSGINVGDTIDLRYKYTITGSDGTNGTVYFVATNATSNYGPLMVSDFALDPSVTYTFGMFNTDGAVNYDDLVVCFTTGTLIITEHGQVPIETLREGDMILTRDNGFQPLRWIGKRAVNISSANAPVLFAANTLGNSQDLIVSPNHRMLFRPPQAQLYFQDTEVLVAAKNLHRLPGVRRITRGKVTYVHILFDRHELVYANGAPSESFFPGPQAMSTLECETRNEVLQLFPELEQTESAFGQTARVCLRPHEVHVLENLMA